MTRNRAERRHHMVRLKKSAVVIALQAMEAKSIRYLLSYSCICSCWMCGHRRYHNGPRVSEIRAKARYAN